MRIPIKAHCSHASLHGGVACLQTGHVVGGIVVGIGVGMRRGLGGRRHVRDCELRNGLGIGWRAE